MSFTHVDDTAHLLQEQVDAFLHKDPKRHLLSRVVLRHHPTVLSTFTPPDLSADEQSAFHLLARLQGYRRRCMSPSCWIQYLLLQVKWSLETVIVCSLIVVPNVVVGVGCIAPLTVVQTWLSSLPCVFSQWTLVDSALDVVRSALDTWSQSLFHYSTLAETAYHHHLERLFFGEGGVSCVSSYK